MFKYIFLNYTVKIFTGCFTLWPWDKKSDHILTSSNDRSAHYENDCLLFVINYVFQKMSLHKYKKQSVILAKLCLGKLILKVIKRILEPFQEAVLYSLFLSTSLFTLTWKNCGAFELETATTILVAISWVSCHPVLSSCQADYRRVEQDLPWDFYQNISDTARTFFSLSTSHYADLKSWSKDSVTTCDFCPWQHISLKIIQCKMICKIHPKSSPLDTTERNK